jgi:hypothetical protein
MGTPAENLITPLAWYPRLVHGTPEDQKPDRQGGCSTGDGLLREKEFIGPISTKTSASLLVGKASGESQNSFRQWLETRPVQF